MMKIIGITGGIGSGKTTIINYIKSKGFVVYIADDAGKKVMQNSEIVKQINSIFDNDVLLPNGLLDRAKIASLVFNDNLLIKRLNEIVHPAVALDFENFKQQHVTEKVIFKESALLFESEFYKQCHATILITAPLEIRIERVMTRDKVTKDAVLNRIKNQLSEEKKAALATYVVENLDLKNTFKSIDDIIIKNLRN